MNTSISEDKNKLIKLVVKCLNNPLIANNYLYVKNILRKSDDFNKVATKIEVTNLKKILLLIKNSDTHSKISCIREDDLKNPHLKLDNRIYIIPNNIKIINIINNIMTSTYLLSNIGKLSKLTDEKEYEEEQLQKNILINNKITELVDFIIANLDCICNQNSTTVFGLLSQFFMSLYKSSVEIDNNYFNDIINKSFNESDYNIMYNKIENNMVIN
jgi:hypothetical protein